MSAQQVTPPGSAAAASTSVPGLVSAPSEIVRLPQELAARLLQGLRTVILSGTVTGQGADGALQVRSQFGEIAVRTGVSVPADRQISLQIPPLTGHAAKLTPAQLSRQPIPASLLLPRPATPASSAPTATATGTATASATTTVANAPVSPAGGPAASIIPAPPAPTAGLSPTSTPPPATSPSGQGPSGVAPPATTQPTPAAGAPPTPLGAAPTPGNVARAAPALTSAPVTEPAAGRSPSTAISASTMPTAETGGRPTPAVPPPLGRLAMTTQLLTQSGGQPAPDAALPPSQGHAPQASQAQGATPQLVTGAPQQPAAGMAGPGAPPTTEAVIGGARIAATTGQALTSPPASGRESTRDAIPIESVRRVPVLREAVSVLSAADPTLATQFVRSVLPQANTQLAATLLFFLAAARGGDVRGWMGGRVATALEDSGRTDLMPKLAAELSASARAAPDSIASEWRSQPIPLYQHGEVGSMAVHVRRSGEDGGADGDSDGDGRRFLLDLDLSRMGPLQFDGLIRDRRFDLVIRSKAAFPDSMRQDIRTLFRDASEAVGLHGGLSFQAGSHDWVTVATARGAQ